MRNTYLSLKMVEEAKTVKKARIWGPDPKCAGISVILILSFGRNSKKFRFEVHFYVGACDRILKNRWTVPLKELHTSETTLAQKIVLTLLNNEFKLKIWNTTSFMPKNPPIFLKKIYKNQFLAYWRGLMVFIHKYKVVYLNFRTYL